MLFVYGRILSLRLVNTVTSDKIFYRLVSRLIKYQMVICYFLYIAGSYFYFDFEKKQRIHTLCTYKHQNKIVVLIVLIRLPFS